MRRQQFSELMEHWRTAGPALFNAYYTRKNLSGVHISVGKMIRTSCLYRGERIKDLDQTKYEEYVAWCCVVAWQNWKDHPCDFFDLSKADQYRVVRDYRQKLLVNPGEQLDGGWYNGCPEEPRAISKSLKRIRLNQVEDVHDS